MTVPPEVAQEHAPHDGLVLLVVFAVLAALATAYAVHLAVRDRSAAPVLAVLGAMAAVVNDAIFDVLWQIWYPANIEPRLWTMLDRPIPFFLVLGYIPFVGVLPVVVARLLDRGVAPRVLWLIALGAAAGNLVVDLLGEATTSWDYYAEGPLKYLTNPPITAAVPIVAGWLLHVTRPRGWRLPLAFAIPPFTLAAVYAGTGWPSFFALHVDGVPRGAQALLGIVTVALSASLVAGVAATQRTRSAHA
jgi:hypothetical protein